MTSSCPFNCSTKWIVNTLNDWMTEQQWIFQNMLAMNLLRTWFHSSSLYHKSLCQKCVWKTKDRNENNRRKSSSTHAWTKSGFYCSVFSVHLPYLLQLISISFQGMEFAPFWKHFVWFRPLRIFRTRTIRKEL